jgi:MFS family permease
MIDAIDFASLIHPALAIAFVFPLIGIVVHYSLQTRNRRMQIAKGQKSAVPGSVGTQHLRLGRWLSNSVVILSLIGLAYPIFSKIFAAPPDQQNGTRTILLLVLFALTIASLFLLNIANGKLQRAGFATLTGIGLVLIGCQPEVFRRGFEWYVSHYYYGMAASMLMIFSLAMFPEIYKDRSNRWRSLHVVLNVIAVLLFISQGFTGTRDLLEIPVSWQKPYIEQLYINNCQTQPCTVQPQQ